MSCLPSLENSICRCLSYAENSSFHCLRTDSKFDSTSLENSSFPFPKKSYGRESFVENCSFRCYCRQTRLWSRIFEENSSCRCQTRSFCRSRASKAEPEPDRRGWCRPTGSCSRWSRPWGRSPTPRNRSRGFFGWYSPDRLERSKIRLLLRSFRRNRKSLFPVRWKVAMKNFLRRRFRPRSEKATLSHLFVFLCRWLLRSKEKWVYWKNESVTLMTSRWKNYARTFHIPRKVDCFGIKDQFQLAAAYSRQNNSPFQTLHAIAQFLVKSCFFVF